MFIFSYYTSKIYSNLQKKLHPISSPFSIFAYNQKISENIVLTEKLLIHVV